MQKNKKLKFKYLSIRSILKILCLPWLMFEIDLLFLSDITVMLKISKLIVRNSSLTDSSIPYYDRVEYRAN